MDIPQAMTQELPTEAQLERLAELEQRFELKLAAQGLINMGRDSNGIQDSDSFSHTLDETKVAATRMSTDESSLERGMEYQRAVNEQNGIIESELFAAFLNRAIEREASNQTPSTETAEQTNKKGEFLQLLQSALELDSEDIKTKIEEYLETVPPVIIEIEPTELSKIAGAYASAADEFIQTPNTEPVSTGNLAFDDLHILTEECYTEESLVEFARHILDRIDETDEVQLDNAIVAILKYRRVIKDLQTSYEAQAQMKSIAERTVKTTKKHGEEGDAYDVLGPQRKNLFKPLADIQPLSDPEYLKDNLGW